MLRNIIARKWPNDGPLRHITAHYVRNRPSVVREGAVGPPVTGCWVAAAAAGRGMGWHAPRHGQGLRSYHRPAMGRPRYGAGSRSSHAPALSCVHHIIPAAKVQAAFIARARRYCTHVARDNIGNQFQSILRRGGVDINIGPPTNGPCKSILALPAPKICRESQNQALRCPTY